LLNREKTDAELQHRIFRQIRALTQSNPSGAGQNSKPAQTIFVFQAIFLGSFPDREKPQAKGNDKAVGAGLCNFFHVVREQRVSLLRFICAWNFPSV
jgi:hypothetical protein